MRDTEKLYESLKYKSPFRGYSISAFREDDTYKVYSYNTLIFSYDLLHKEIIKFNSEKYSRTTSKYQNIIKDFIENHGLKYQEDNQGESN